MRMYMKRLVLVCAGALATTLLVSILNTANGPEATGDRQVWPSKERSGRQFPATPDAKISRLTADADAETRRKTGNVAGDIDAKNLANANANGDADADAAPPNLRPTPTKSAEKPPRRRLLSKKAAPPTIPPPLSDIDESIWAKDDQPLLPQTADAAATADAKNRRKSAPDAGLVELRRKLHLDDFRSSTVDCPNRTTLEAYFAQRYKKSWPKDDTWDSFYAQISNCEMYPADSRILQSLLDDISTQPIKTVLNMDGGTQIKLIITFENGKQAVFKPMRFSRNYETDPNHFYFSDFERHHAEIAAFHLDKVLGFRRAVPTVGRVVNISSELLANAERTLAKTFFISPAKNLCFVGKCDYYCDTTHAICGNPDTKEGSMQMFLPDDELVPRQHTKSPFKRTYSKRNQDADWQKDSMYCNWKVKYTPPYSNGRRLLDIVDMYILDFLMGNQDRHHYETFTVFENYPSSLVHLDNGRAFGKPYLDDMSILAPLSQCCVVRPSTVKTLFDFYTGATSLSEAMRTSLSRDPVTPVLAEKYLRALDRRLEIVLREIGKCLEKVNGDYKKVLLNSFYNPEAPAETEDDDDEDD